MQECLLQNNRKMVWFLDSGCSRHMTRDKSKFFCLEKRKDGGYAAFGDNKKALIKGVGKIGKPNSAQIENYFWAKVF